MRLEVLTASLEDPRVVYALLRLSASAPALVRQRRPVNLAVVIDRSSSMRGPRIAQAALAARRLVERLGEQDRLTVITFDGAARVLFAPGPVTAEARARLLDDLAAMDTGAGTNLAAGWRKGCELAAAGFVRDAIARVVLLTDGLPTVGPSDSGQLGEIAEAEAARGVTTTAMGIGEGWDDELLGEIARRGKGGFYYLASAEAIPAAFGRELDGVFSVAATDVQVKVLPEPEVSQCEVLHRLPSRASPDGLTIEIGEIAEGAPRQLLVRLARAEGAPGKLLAKVTVTYRARTGEAAPHLDRIMAPAAPVAAETGEVAIEHLRIAVAAAVDQAWARRAGGRRAAALESLATVRSAVAGARDRGLAPAEPLDQLLREIAEAEAGVRGAEKEIERHRRSARERSYSTLLGQSVIRPIPPPDDD